MRALVPLLLWARLAAAESLPQIEEGWTKLDEGLFLREFVSPQKSSEGDSKITVLRIDPRFHTFRLLSAPELGEPKMTAREWCKKYHLVAAVNAGMYQNDGKTAVGYMQNFDYVNNRRLSRSMKAVLAFNPVDPNVPPIQIIDRKCQRLEELRPRYRTLIQGIRMIGCSQDNVWSQHEALWSMAVLGMTQDGQALFIFTQSPYSPHELIDILLALPLSIHSAMYLEGGSEASLYLAHAGVEMEKFGTHGTGFWSLFRNQGPWPIPHVIGITRK
jgi:phosphodiester glycosidase